MEKQINHLGISESFKDRYTLLEITNSWFRGSHHIEILWVSENITVKCSAVLPFRIGIRDHHPIITEVNTMSFIVESPVK